MEGFPAAEIGTVMPCGPNGGPCDEPAARRRFERKFPYIMWGEWSIFVNI